MSSSMMPGPEPEEPGNCPECDGTGTCEVGEVRDGLLVVPPCYRCGGSGSIEPDEPSMSEFL